MTLQGPDLVVLVLYVLAVFGFGCWFVRTSGSTSHFMAAGGSIPGWAVGLSIFGTYLSSNTFLGVPGKAYGQNFNGFVFSLTLPLAAWVATRYFVPFYRRSGEISAYHHLEARFGPWARVYAVACYLLTQIGRMGTIMYGVALGLHALTQWDVASIITVTGVLVTVYTLMGGIEAVIWTDVIQSIVLMCGALLVLMMLIMGMPEGPTQAISIANAEQKMSLGSWTPEFRTSTIWVMLLYGVFINLNNFGIDQSYVQRYHASGSEREAARSVWFGALLYVPISLLFFVIGAMLFSYYDTHPALLDEVRRDVAVTQLESDGVAATESAIAARASMLTPADIGDKVLPHFIARRLPFGTAGLLIAAIFAAAMSSIDTSLNSSATVILKDLYSRWINPEVDERGSMKVLRISTIVMGSIGTGVALALIGVKSILDAWWILSGIFAGGMLGLFLLGIVVRRATSGIGLVSVILGILVITWMTFSPGWERFPEALRNPLHANMIIVCGTLTIFLTGLILTQILRGPVDPSSAHEQSST